MSEIPDKLPENLNGFDDQAKEKILHRLGSDPEPGYKEYRDISKFFIDKMDLNETTQNRYKPTEEKVIYLQKIVENAGLRGGEEAYDEFSILLLELLRKVEYNSNLYLNIPETRQDIQIYPEKVRKDCVAINKQIEQAINQKRIIDLGCGKHPDMALLIALRYGASEFVGVDKFTEFSFRNDSLDFLVCGHRESILQDYKRRKLRYASVKSDMLLFLSSQPSNSANIILNGIDQCIISDREYLIELVKEIDRVVGRDHLAFGVDSPYLDGLKDNQYGYTNIINSLDTIDNFYIMKKQEKKEKNKEK